MLLKTDVLENAYVPVDPPSVDLVACTLSLIDRQSLSVPTGVLKLPAVQIYQVGADRSMRIVIPSS